MDNKKLFLRVTVLLLCLCLLASCGSEAQTNGSIDPVATTESNAPQVNADPLTLISNGMTDYKIIYAAEGETWERSMAVRLQNTVLAATGVKIPVEKDTDSAVDANAKEIIFATADNNRASTYTAKGGVNLGYNVFVDGNRLIMEVGSKTGAFFAISQIAKDYFNVDLEAGEIVKRVDGLTAFKVEADYTVTRSLDSSEFPYLGIPLESLQIAYNGDYYIHKCIAMDLQKEIDFMLGVDLWLWDSAYGTEDGQKYITFEQDDTLDKGDWEIRPSSESIVIAANGYYGFESAVTQFAKLKNSDGYFDLIPGETIGGNYLETLGRAERYQSHKYAYDKTGEYRVMFYNVLFWDSDGNGKYFPAQERNRVQVEMVAEYMPDVFGCQEFNISKRDGLYALPELLEELGYAETIDPVVDNASQQDYWLGGAVTDENGKLLGYKPGNGKPIGYDVDENKYGFAKTYYNHTPLFYNTATTKCIASEYYWYKNQWALGELVTDEYGTYYATTHENGAADAASKSLTWGVFESLETGERYIAISTHMCTRSDYIRGLQAQEVVDLIAKLAAEYNCPIFFGGDMNGNATRQSANYMLFMSEEVDYTSLQDDAIAEIFTSKLLSSHGYPDHSGGVLTTGGTPTVAAPGASIDQIFVTNYDEKLSVKVFGIVADMCSLRGSDHLPIFVDFNIK